MSSELDIFSKDKLLKSELKINNLLDSLFDPAITICASLSRVLFNERFIGQVFDLNDVYHDRVLLSYLIYCQTMFEGQLPFDLQDIIKQIKHPKVHQLNQLLCRNL